MPWLKDVLVNSVEEERKKQSAEIAVRLVKDAIHGLYVVLHRGTFTSFPALPSSPICRLVVLAHKSAHLRPSLDAHAGSFLPISQLIH